MSSVHHLREFIRERLTAAVEEIFTEFDKTIVLFEKEIDRHRRLLDTCKKKAQRNFHTAELPHQHVYKQEDVPMDQQLCNQERDCRLDHVEPETPQIKDMQVEFWNRHEVEHLLKKNTNSFSMLQGKSICEETSESSIIDFEEDLDGPHRLSQINFITSEPPQEHLAEEDNLWNSQQLYDHKRKSSLDQEVQTRVLQQNSKEQVKREPPQVNEYHEEPEPLQIKEEQDFFSIQDEEQLVLKEETDVLIINFDECDSIKSGPTSTQLLSHSSASSPLREESSLDTDETTPYVCNTCGKRFSDLT
ncbi:uncharacterized protein LOC119407583 [Nematolebias whitei]|uniref:uncharacterized protein LOC119407583 n=1 Tax=Nematolebias whitei TaxID=451745 RepID=UPI0018974EA6|nr:uncharacterized protein LOC119407583 [Nematolebias whitei]